MLEKELEEKCRKHALKNGALFMKWSSPSQRGVPDRILIINGRVVFVEMKAAGGKPTKLQEYRHAEMRARGAEVFVIDDFGSFEDLLGRLST